MKVVVHYFIGPVGGGWGWWVGVLDEIKAVLNSSQVVVEVEV